MVVDIYPGHRTEGTHGCQKESEIQGTTEEGAGKKTGNAEEGRTGQEKGHGEENDGPAGGAEEEAGRPARRTDQETSAPTGASPEGATGEPYPAAGRTGRPSCGTGSPGR